MPYDGMLAKYVLEKQYHVSQMIGVMCVFILVKCALFGTQMVQKWTRALVLVFFILMDIWCILSLWEISLDFSSWSFCFWCGVEFAMVMSTEKNAFTFSLIARGLFFFYTGIILNLILECYSVLVSILSVTVLLFTGYLIIRAFGEKRSPMNWLKWLFQPFCWSWTSYWDIE